MNILFELLTGINFSNIFKSNWDPYKYKETVEVKEEIFENVYNDLMMNDPQDMEVIPTGKYKMVKYEVWVSYNRKSGLPRYKHIKVI